MVKKDFLSFEMSIEAFDCNFCVTRIEGLTVMGEQALAKPIKGAREITEFVLYLGLYCI